jgi:predicted Zn-dependent protease
MYLRLAHFSLALGVLAATLGCPSVEVSESDERELGRESAAQADSQFSMVDDTVIMRFVDSLGRSMTSNTSRADLEWVFKVVNTPEVNAFALPGGFVYVTRGLIEFSDRLDMLAGVMGHEIGHVVRRHSVKQLENSAKTDAAAILVCALTGACRTVGGSIAVELGAERRLAVYSQRAEAEADSEAVVNTLRAGVDPNGLTDFLAAMLAKRTGESDPIEAFFSTHPTDEARIAALRRHISALETSSQRELIRDTPAFHVIQERVRALPKPPPPKDQNTSGRDSTQ